MVFTNGPQTTRSGGSSGPIGHMLGISFSRTIEVGMASDPSLLKFAVPRCKTVLSMDAASAHNCANQTPEAQQAQQVQQARKRDVSAIATMPVKD